LAVLDMAGTTVAITDVIPGVWQMSFAQHGLALPPAAIVATRGKSKRAAVRELLAACGPVAFDDGLAERIHDTFTAQLQVRMAAGVAPIPGALAALQQLHSLALRIVLITGFDRGTTTRIVTTLGWHSAVDGVLCADDVQAGRPAPDLILRAMETTGEKDPARVLVAGDTAADLQAAANAGAGWIVGVLSGAHDRAELEQHPHSVLLESIAELPGWIQSRSDR
jgi:phosphonatase-like hydrolase